MKIKTSDLIGPALDWAVAKCSGMENEWFHDYRIGYPVSVSTEWSLGGPIIEKEKIAVGHQWEDEGSWLASTHHPDSLVFSGPTPLSAAMRCYVASVLGDDVEIPEELKAGA